MTNPLRSETLNATDLELVCRWMQAYQGAISSEPLGGCITSVEQQIMDGIVAARSAGTEFTITELDVEWILDWAERAFNPSHTGGKVVFSPEQALVERLERLSGG